MKVVSWQKENRFAVLLFPDSIKKPPTSYNDEKGVFFMSRRPLQSKISSFLNGCRFSKKINHILCCLNEVEKLLGIR